MRLKTIKEANILPGSRVILRVDYNVPVGKDGKVDNKEDWRIVKTLPTIKYLIRKKAKVIIISHLGRPAGKRVAKLSLKPAVIRLSQLLKKKVSFCSSWDFKKVNQQIEKLPSGRVLMLENLRFHPGEEKSSKSFAKSLASFGNIYVNDAFANSHRSHASMLAITEYLPSFAGLLLAEEIERISDFLKKPERPFVGIMGGVKISTKIKVIRVLLKKVDYILLAGGLANTVLKGMGLPIGKSVVELDMVDEIKKSDSAQKKLRVPIDVVVCTKNSKFNKCRITAAEMVKDSEKILDIGPGTIHLFQSIISQARTIFWNGPVGMVEEKDFKKGTFKLLAQISKSKANVLIGGGETVEAALEYDKNIKNKKNIFISTGGGAMLDFIEDGSLPAIKPLVKK